MIRVPRKPGALRTRLVLAFTLLLFIFAGVTIAVALTRTVDAQREALDHSRQNFSRMIAPVAARLVSENDLRGFYEFLQEIAGAPAIAAIQVSDDENITLFRKTNPENPPGWLTRTLAADEINERTLTSRFLFADGSNGTMAVTFSLNPLNEAVNKVLAHGLALAGALLLSGLLLTRRFLTPVSDSLEAAARTAGELASGNRSPKIRLIDSGYREIRNLNSAISDCVSAMQHNMYRLEETDELLDYSEGRLRGLVNGMHEILLELDIDGRITFLNPSWEKTTGFPIEECIGRLFTDYLLDDEAISLFSPVNLGRIQEHNRQIRMRCARDNPLWVNLEAESQYDSSGDNTGVVGTLQDITESLQLNKLVKRYQDELYLLSVTDPLTGIYNRRHFDNQLEVILTEHLAANQPVCLLLIDLDGFKFINDTYGHPFGDEVLKTTANLLGQHVRRNDYIARLAGDEFAMVLKNTSLQNATAIARKLHATLSATYISLPVGRLQLQTSIGVAEAPIHGNNAQELVSAADVALYHSKQRGRNRVEALSPDISKAVMSIFSQGFQLRNALERGNINPAFQPICNMANREPLAYEVLARMRHNESIIQAKDFIVLAEELGLTREVDLHIIKQALTHTPKEHSLFLNVDLSSFNDRNFVQELGNLLRPACEAGRKITLEITERETVPITATLQEDIQGLRSFGCKLALDDFGSGYSTYNFLNLFRPDYIKIEGAFVRGMLENEANHKIVAHIHDLATSFGMETIAESVENEETLLALQKIGIRTAQGHHFGMPQMMN